MLRGHEKNLSPSLLPNIDTFSEVEPNAGTGDARSLSSCLIRPVQRANEPLGAAFA